MQKANQYIAMQPSSSWHARRPASPAPILPICSTRPRCWRHGVARKSSTKKNLKSQSYASWRGPSAKDAGFSRGGKIFFSFTKKGIRFLFALFLVLILFGERRG